MANKYCIEKLFILRLFSIVMLKFNFRIVNCKLQLILSRFLASTDITNEVDYHHIRCVIYICTKLTSTIRHCQWVLNPPARNGKKCLCGWLVCVRCLFHFPSFFFFFFHWINNVEQNSWDCKTMKSHPAHKTWRRLLSQASSEQNEEQPLSQKHFAKHA